MEIFNLITASVLIVLLTGFTTYLFFTIIFNVKTGIRYRKSLAKTVYALRLSKMFDALGIDTYEYLHKERVADIKNQVKRCSECENTQQCDDGLSSNAINTENISYCNNESDLRDIALKEMRSGKSSDESKQIT